MTSDQHDIRDVPASGPEPSAWGCAELVVVNRFRISEMDLASFHSTLDPAVALLRTRTGLESLRVLHNLDESDLWALVTTWQDVGCYRRALSGVESKMVIWPLFALAVNEPSAYLSPAELGDNRPRRQS